MTKTQQELIGRGALLVLATGLLCGGIKCLWIGVVIGVGLLTFMGAVMSIFGAIFAIPAILPASAVKRLLRPRQAPRIGKETSDSTNWLAYILELFMWW